MKTKEDKLWTAVIILVIVVFGQAFAIAFGKDLIDDLKATANGYESDRKQQMVMRATETYVEVN